MEQSSRFWHSSFNQKGHWSFLANLWPGNHQGPYITGSSIGWVAEILKLQTRSQATLRLFFLISEVSTQKLKPVELLKLSKYGAKAKVCQRNYEQSRETTRRDPISLSSLFFWFALTNRATVAFSKIFCLLSLPRIPTRADNNITNEWILKQHNRHRVGCLMKEKEAREEGWAELLCYAFEPSFAIFIHIHKHNLLFCRQFSRKICQATNHRNKIVTRILLRPGQEQKK